MLVRNWMTPDVLTVSPDTSLLKIGKMMRDNNVRRLPVVDAKGQVVGIISDRDVRDASPSKATTLDMYEMHYLLAEIKARDIMTPRPLTVKPTDTVEIAAMIMLDKKVGGLPVVEPDGKLCGIIAEQDVFKALVKAASRLDFPLPTSRGQCGLCLIFSGKKAPGYFLCFPRTTMPAKEISFSGYAAWKAVKRRINLWKR